MMPKGGKSTSMPTFSVPAALMLSTVCAAAVEAIAPTIRPAPIAAIIIRLEMLIFPTLSLCRVNLPPARVPSASRRPGELLFHAPRQQRQRPTENEIDRSHRGKDQEGAEGRVIDDLALARQLGETDDRC